MTDGGLTARVAAELVLGLGGGFALAIAHLAALGANVRLYLAPGAAWRALGVHIARLAAVAAAFTVTATVGAPALLAALVGFSLGRIVRLGRLR